MKKVLSLVFLLAFLFLLASCGGPGEKNAHSGIFYDYITAPFGTLCMYNSSDTTPYLLAKRCTARLYTMLVNEDGTGHVFKGDLAEKAPVALDESGTRWQISLRRGYCWQNGDEITADDFIYSMRQLLDPAAANRQASVISSSGYAPVKNAAEYFSGKASWEEVGFRKTDDYTIEIETAKKVSAELLMRTFERSYTMLVYEPLFEQFRNADGTSAYGTSADAFMSAGPFFLTEWVPDAKWEFTVNPDYVHADSYKVEKMVVSVVSDPNSAVELFLAGELDYLSLSFDQWEGFEDDPRTREYWNNSLQYMFVNTGNPNQNGLLGKLDFRKALYYGTDRVALSELLGAVPATRIVRKSVIGDPDTGTAFVDMPGSSLYVDNGNRVLDESAAQRYLAKALDACELENAHLEIYYGETSTHTKTASEFLQSQYEDLFGGKLSVTLRSVPAAQQFNLRRWNPDDPTAFEANIGSVTPSADSPYYTFQYYTSDYNPPRFNYANADFDRIYAQASSSDEPKEVVYLCQQLEKMLLDELVVVPLYEIPSKALFSERVVLPVKDALSSLGFAYEFAAIKD